MKPAAALLILLCLATPAAAGNEWIEVGGVGYATNPGDASLMVVLVRSPRPRGDRRHRGYNMDLFPPGRWITIDPMWGVDWRGHDVSTGVPADAEAVCLVARGNISMGSVMAGGVQFVVGLRSDERAGGSGLWKIRATAGSAGVREQAYGCVALADDGTFQMRWDTTGWCPKCNGWPAGTLTLRVNSYAREIRP